MAGRFIALTAVAALMTACASYQSRVEEARNLLKLGENQKAADKLKPLAEKENDDQLVYLFDYGTALQSASDFKDSNNIFLKADQVADIVDYHSLSRDAGSILLNEGLVQYKGDDYEKVLINAMLAVNFLMLHDKENALVETRRLNEKLYKYKFEAKRNYEQNPFAFYLSALIWESDRNYDNAYIDFNKTYEVKSDIPYLRQDLIRAAINADRGDEVEKWKRQFPEIQVRPEWKNKDYGEIVLIYEQGWGPRKRPRPGFPRIPKLFPTPSFTQRAKLVVDGVGEEFSQTVFSVQDVAIKTLEDQYAGLIAKRVAGIAAKAVVADQIAQRNKLLGQLAFIGMNLADQADLRQWSTLPQTFQIAKILVPAGHYQAGAVGLSFSGTPTGEMLPKRDIVVDPHQKTFILWRSYR
jgi:hypothetical protein